MVKRSLYTRPVSTVAGALMGGSVVAVFEAFAAASGGAVPMLDALLGDAAALVPVATIVGLAVAAVGIAFDPKRGDAPAKTVFPRSEEAEEGQRRLSAARALVWPPAFLGLCVTVARGVRTLVGRDHPVGLLSLDVGLFSLAVLVFFGVLADAGVRLAPRVLPRRARPVPVGVFSTTLALAGALLGASLGDPHGDGPTPLAIFGLLANPELHAATVVALSAVAAGALAGDVVSRASFARSHRVWVVSALLVAGGWTLEATALPGPAERPEVALALAADAPLGRLGLTLMHGAGDGADVPRGRCDATFGPCPPDSHDAAGARGSAKGDGTTAPSDLNLVLVTVDTLRTDLGFLGYPRPVSPHLDELASRATVFERAYSMASYTGKSIGPMMIGKFASECVRDGAHFDTYAGDNTFLAERLHDAGYHTMGVASHWYFKPKYGLAQGMDVWDLSSMAPEAATNSVATSALLSDVAIGLLSNPENVSPPFFLWVHYFDPHQSYLRHPEAPDFSAGARSPAKALYDGEVWYTDHHLGRLLDFIASQPWSARTVIVVTADHGEAFDEHRMNGHGVDLWERLVRVPLIVYVPGGQPHRVAVKRSLVDLVPTVLDLLHVPQPPAGELSGESTALAVTSADGAGTEERDIYLDIPNGPQVTQHRAIIHGRTPGMKLMHEGGPIFFVFDLSKDERETNDLAGDRKVFGPLYDVFNKRVAALREVRVPPLVSAAR